MNEKAFNAAYQHFTSTGYDGSPEDFSKLLNTNANYLRKSNDGTKAVVKYSGTQPSFLNGKTTYTHAEILVEMSTEDWLKEV